MSNSPDEFDVKIRETLAPYLSNLNIIRDSAGSYTVAPHRIEFQGTRWNEINDAIKNLHGSWVNATKFTRGYWRIPKV